MVTITTQRRLKKLEAGGPTPPCDYCGGGDGDPDEPYEIVFDDELPDDFEETCPQCGRELATPIYFDDDPRAPWNVQ